MSFETRLPLIQQIQNLRGSRVICFLTSLRPGIPAQMAEDQVRVIFDHLEAVAQKPIPKLDIFLASNGGSGTVPWRLVALFREYSTSFNVVIPYRAYSAASLLALGADEIVMHPFAELGPIDPTVSNDFNPVEQGTGRRLGISVEDVRAYVNFIKSTVGITHEDELIRAVEALTAKVHPLSLGNVERFVMQSRMIARKILKTHMRDETDEHKMDEIIENMASKLYFHGHPINRDEARNDLRLKVAVNLSAQLETLIWNLYRDFEIEFENRTEFNPAMALANQPVPLPPLAHPPQPGELTQAGYLLPPGQPAPNLPTHESELLYAMIESPAISSRYRSRRRYTLLPTQQPGQTAIREDILEQGWIHSQAPAPAPPAQQSQQSAADAPSDGGSPSASPAT
jgi:hypothetical protein